MCRPQRRNPRRQPIRKPLSLTRGASQRIALLILLLFAFAQAAAAAPVDPLVQEQAGQLPIDPVEQYWNKLMKEYGGYFPENETPSFMELLLSGGGFHPLTVVKGIVAYFFHEVIHNGKLLATIVILTVFSVLLETLQSAFEKNAVSKVAYAISYMVLMIIAINSFSVAIGYAKSAIQGMIDFMIAVIPLLLALLASTGSVATVSVMHPIIIFMIHAVGTFIYLVIFPLLFFSTILHIVSSLSDKYKVTRLANLLRNISSALLGLFITIFLAVLSIQGATRAVTDGVTIRTAKYITGTFVPIVGRMFVEASDTVITASLLVKNAVGLAGVIILLLLSAFPAIKILTLAFIYNVSSAALQPLGDNPLVSCLGTIGKNLIYVFAALAVVGLMFFFAITILIAAGNVAVMIR
jgi:stage III sporulation protein AE